MKKKKNRITVIVPLSNCATSVGLKHHIDGVPPEMLYYVCWYALESQHSGL